jgi:hypothetical protein
MENLDEISRDECRKLVDELWRSFLNFAGEGSQALGEVCIQRFEERMSVEAAKMPSDKAARYLAMIDEERGFILDEYTRNPEGLKRRLGVRPRPQTQGGSCFIATAVYGNYDSPQVRDLRFFRDRYLTSDIGKRVVAGYYKVSPPIAAWLVRSPNVSTLVRWILNGVVWLIARSK